MKTLLVVGSVLAGVYLGVNVEQRSHAMQVSKLSGVSYFQIINRSPAMWIKLLQGGN